MFSASRRRPDSNDLYWVENIVVSHCWPRLFGADAGGKGLVVDSHLPDIIYEASIPMKGIR